MRQGAIQLRLAYQEADSEFRNMRTAVSTVLKQLPHRDAEEVRAIQKITIHPNRHKHPQSFDVS
jgi:hypothetical protein